MTLPGYELLEELCRTDRYALVRARRREDGGTVLLKAPHDARGSLAWLIEREHRILREAAAPGVCRPFGLLRHGGVPWLVLEDPGGAPPAPAADPRRDLASFFGLAMRLATVLSELHRRDIVLGSLSPRGILVHPATGDVCLVDLALAVDGSDARPPLPAHLLGDALPYAAPEQTGRTGRTPDHRADLYSLGMTLYELLIGAPPFRSGDPLELIHWHLARHPAPPAAVDASLPEPLSGVVMKLVAKAAEERYQTALGLRHDLEICARAWAADGRIPPFALGARDVPDRLLVPQRLYGRDREVEALLGVFEAAADGPAAMVLVAGYAGIGKTALISELYRPILRQRGYFIGGKFDLVARNIPFGALIQAFRGLVDQLLTEGEERLALWRARLGEALGGSAGVLTEVVPELTRVLGPQPPPPPLGPAESQDRFRIVFQIFLGALAQRAHPLVIFLDDLQWADAATLGLLESLLTSGGVRHLLLIGAYRDNEVGPDHRLARTLEALGAAGARLHRLSLGPLGPPDLARLIGETLHREPEEVESLAHLVARKTGGNPFFVIQFLKALRDARLVAFDHDEGRWTFRTDAIATAGITDNVVDLMTGKIRRLSAKAQTALTLGACIGNRFDLATLATVSRQGREAAAEDLREALDEGLVLPAGEAFGAPGEAGPGETGAGVAYLFLHDRVQQAAYALIPDGEKPALHLAVGRLLLERWDPAAEERLFDIVNHLNLGSRLIGDGAERVALARLNLRAGRKAKASTAYQAALGYIRAGLDLLGEGHWESDYELMLDLHLEALECEHLCGRADEAERRFERLLARARTRLDRSRIYSQRVVQLESLSRYADAIRLGREALAPFGVTFPDSPAERTAALERELAAIETLVGGRPIDALVDLPVMGDPETRAVMGLLVTLHIPGYLLGDKPFTLLNTATMVRLSLTHGNSPESAYAYVLHAMLLALARGRYREAYEFGLLGLKVNERLPDPKLRARSLMNFAWAVSPWRVPLEASVPVCRETFRVASDSGLFTEAAWALFNENWIDLLTARDLAAFAAGCAANLETMRRVRMPHIADGGEAVLQWARALQGLTREPGSLSDAAFDEEAYQRVQAGNSLNLMFYFVAKLAVLYAFEAFEEACAVARRSAYIAEDFTGNIWDEQRTFYYALALAAAPGAGPAEARRAAEAEVERLNGRLRAWAENSPKNFEAQHLLVSAELARVRGRDGDAVVFYERAAAAAAAHGRLRELALANELCGRFWLGRGNEAVGRVYLREARRRYDEWGAVGKVRHLESRHPFLFEGETAEGWPARQGGAARPAGPEATPPDLASVMKAAHAIAEELVLEEVLRKLMRIAIENAGAQKGVFLEERDGRLVVEAEAILEREEVALRRAVPLEASGEVPRTVVSYCRTTGESVVVGDALADGRFSGDPYVASARPRSILCVPVMHRGRLGGVLYLENGLTADAFTAERVELLQVLAAQAAIALENARLYEEAKQEAEQRRRAEETIRAIAEGTASFTGGDFFRSLVGHLASALRVRYAFVAECTDRTKGAARTLAFWKGDALGENFAYGVAATPCAKVVAGETCHYREGVRSLFPDDKDLVELGAESYLGVPMLDSSGEVVGHLAVLDDKPMGAEPHAISILRTFAARAGAELKRQQAEEGLRRALAEVGRLKNQLQAENVYLQEEIRREHHFEEMVGTSAALLEVIRKVERVAPTDATVLILGETGTGKELVARAVHGLSRRRDRPLVKVNCGAISAGLVESELFGHVKGAFTGALERRVGRFELADGGTLFLDEVGELPPETQVKLLRVLQDGEFEPVGSSRTVRVNVRVIAATNRDLEEAVRAGRFRADLFYRLNVFPLPLPPLRERRSDIPELVTFFLSRYSKQFGKRVEAVDPQTMALLMEYAWPGNVRELQNVIERAVVLAQGPVLTLDRDLLPAREPGGAPAEARPAAAAAAPRPAPAPPPDLPTLEEMERRHILAALERSQGVIEGPAGAAAILRLHPNTLRSRMKKLQISRTPAA
jgi:predicted ATPase/transcriptional regulator with GAF, ATPase, and Fis domain